MVDRNALGSVCTKCPYPTVLMQQGVVTFQSIDEVNAAFSGVGELVSKHAVPLMEFVEQGLPAAGIQKQDASNIVHSMMRQSWIEFCRAREFLEYQYSAAIGFHVGRDLAAIGKKIPWGRQGERRSSMLRNIAKGHVWQFGVTAPSGIMAFPTFQIEVACFIRGSEGQRGRRRTQRSQEQHRLRRTVCKGWRNKQWHGRLLAFLELLSGEGSSINLRLAENASVALKHHPCYSRHL